ncbi:MAG: HAD family hydrolase [Lachnospiraceae bacterium]|nr:HAD family hydrolase [Lachnospiraceae bacterium]
MLKAILFDLDGTLLPMDQDEFTQEYLNLLAEKFSPYRYEPKKLIETVWMGTAAMMRNNGKQSNEAVFWEKFSEVYGKEKMEQDRPLFDNFYAKDFEKAKKFCGYHVKSAETVRTAKQLGYRVVLATNPIFPQNATVSRIRWAGLEPSDFEFITTYENTGYCKPNSEYYRDIAERLGVQPEECLMVGNDVSEDMVAETVGMKVFLLTNCLINKERCDISVYPRGNFKQLINILKNKMSV